MRSAFDIVFYLFFFFKNKLFESIDRKVNMVDESLNDYLQIGIIQYLNVNCKSQEEINKSLNDIGFRVGYSLIEKLVVLCIL